MSVICHCVDEPLFYSDLLLAFVYATMMLNSEHAHNTHTRGEGRCIVGDDQYVMTVWAL